MTTKKDEAHHAQIAPHLRDAEEGLAELTHSLLIPPEDMRRQCQVCVHAHQCSVDTWECHHGPPTVVIAKDPKSEKVILGGAWPAVHPVAWCSQWKYNPMLAAWRCDNCAAGFKNLVDAVDHVRTRHYLHIKDSADE